MDFNHLPPLELEGDSYLEVFTHSSIRREDDPAHKFAFVGEMLLNLAIVRHWYEKSISLQELKEKKEQSLSDELLGACIEKYGLQSELRRNRAEHSEVNLKDCRDFLNVYIGALYEQSSISGVQQWVSRLIDPDGEVPYSPLNDAPTEPSPPLTVTTPPTAPPPTQTPPPLPPYSPPPPSIGNSSITADRITLSIFNECAQKRGHAVTFEANHSGEAHRLIWTIICLVDGVEKGTGSASKQKEAKERAVREAWNAMGWDAPGAVNSPQPAPQVLSPISPSIPLQNHSSLFAATGSLPVPLEYVTVAAFNETATKQRYKISWVHEATGDPHMPNWKMICKLNDEVKGTGYGSNKKEAMQQAVRDAWQNMGWS